MGAGYCRRAPKAGRAATRLNGRAQALPRRAAATRDVTSATGTRKLCSELGRDAV